MKNNEIYNEQNKERNKVVLDIITKGASLILIVISIVIYVAGPFVSYLFQGALSHEELFKITSISAIIILIFAVILYCMGTMKKFRELALCDNIIELNELSTMLNNNLETSDKLASHIRKCLNTTNENLVIESYIIYKISDYYIRLKKVREDTEDHRSIRLMNFSTLPASRNKSYTKDEISVKKYFNKELMFCKNKPESNVYKIVTIHTKEKLEECRNLVNGANKMKLHNFHLAYLNIDKFNNDLPELIGADIIGDEVFLMNPKYARITPKSNWAAIYMKSPIIAEKLGEYHHALWEEITDGRGYILYDGEKDIINPDIEDYWKKIEKRLVNNSNDENGYSDNNKIAHKKEIKIISWIKSLFLQKK